MVWRQRWQMSVFVILMRRKWTLNGPCPVMALTSPRSSFLLNPLLSISPLTGLVAVQISLSVCTPPTPAKCVDALGTASAWAHVSQLPKVSLFASSLPWISQWPRIHCIVTLFWLSSSFSALRQSSTSIEETFQNLSTFIAAWVSG